MNIKDIADMAKVSASTVSKILNKKDEDISEETRKRVLKVVKECQYVPYSKIRNTKTTKTNILGLVVPNSYKASKELAYYIEQSAKKNGYSLMVSYVGQETNSEEQAVKILVNKQVEGIILVSLNHRIDGIKEYTDKEKIPLLLLQNNQNINIPSIYYSQEEAAFIATNYLIELGHRNIGCLYDQDKTGENTDFEKGYARALYKNEILVEKENIFVALTPKEAGQIGVKKLMNTNVTAIICSDTEVSCATYGTLQSSGVNIPKDISVISTLDASISEFLNPPLTGVEIPLASMGEQAIEMLVELVEGKKRLSQPIRKLDLILNKRDSVQRPPKGKWGQSKKIIVVGSMNMDVTIKVPKILIDGETTIATDTDLIPGGKGANQAVGAGKLGGVVYAIGRLGNDSDAKIIYNNLIKNSVKTDGIIFDTNMVSGKAYINVAENGESTIAIYSGANQNLDQKQIKKFKHLFLGAEFCLLSTEIPKKTVEYTVAICLKNNVKIILKPSAVMNLEESILQNIDYMIPNRKEINVLIPGQQTIEEKANYLYQKGVKNVIVTLGSKGCYLKNKKYAIHIPSADFIPLDTTGAADAFISALAVYLGEGNDLLSSISFATYSAGISITNLGTQPALPDRLTLDLYQEEINSLINIKK
ncbi:MAG TPA: substrate-binding domain-containing protein [Epulopiscium sp.]|nr:substrate-binding domain-containing protein [Candidatus Epulonipiscium sp.]